MIQNNLQSRIFNRNFETQRFYQNETGYNGVYSGDNLPEELKDRASFGFN